MVAASNTYFLKDLHKLSPGEAALASLPKSPDQYNPKVNITNAVNRRNFVLKEMFQKINLLDNKTLRKELQKELITNFNKNSKDENNYKLLEGFLADEIRIDLNNLFDSNFLSRGNLIIKTSLDLNIQMEANNILANELTNLDIK